VKVPGTAAAALLAETRAYGIQLVAEGGRLRIGAPEGALSPALRAKIIANKPEILALLRGETEDSATAYERDVRAWRENFVTHLARGRGYPEELVRIAVALIGRQPIRHGFTVGKEILSLEVGEGCEVRIHRTPQAWCVDDEGG
jgi:hypothetical protein